MSKFIQLEDGYYSLTSAGTTAITFLIYLAVIITALGIILIATSKKKENRPQITTRQLVFSAVALAIAFPLSYLKLFHLPWGGSVTLCSMFFVTIIGYWYGAGVGFAAAFAYSLLQFIQGGGSYMLSPLQVCLDYLLAFTALGASGFFHGKKNGMMTGYIVAILLRGLFHTIGGYLYWMDYMPDDFPASLSVVYPIVYNYAYIVIEGIITVIVLLLPPVKKALQRIERETE